MKTILNLAITAVVSMAVISCTKNQLPANDFETTQNNDPAITSKIFTKTNDPASMEFGAGTVINTGARVAFYLPYGINKDALQTATITLSDAVTEETLGTFNLLPSTDASAATLNIPMELWYVPYMFAAVDIDNNYTGRSVTITTHMAGQIATSDDILPNAFTVQ